MTNMPRIRFITLAAASVALVGSLAPAQAAPNSNSTANRAGATVHGQRQSAEAPRRLCVQSEMPNPRIRRNLCRTQAQWDRAGPIPTAE